LVQWRPAAAAQARKVDQWRLVQVLHKDVVFWRIRWLLLLLLLLLLLCALNVTVDVPSCTDTCIC